MAGFNAVIPASRLDEALRRSLVAEKTASKSATYPQDGGLTKKADKKLAYRMALTIIKGVDTGAVAAWLSREKQPAEVSPVENTEFVN